MLFLRANFIIICSVNPLSDNITIKESFDDEMNSFAILISFIASEIFLSKIFNKYGLSDLPKDCPSKMKYSWRKDKLSNIVKKNCEKFIVKSDFISDNIIYNLIAESVPINNKYKKILKVNDDQSLEILQKIYDLAPFLYFLPETERLFQSSPSIRRRLIDQFIFTNQNNYNKLINKYTRLLQERSKLL